MNKKNFLLASALLLIYALAYSQKQLTPDQKAKDSQEFEKFKKDYPQLFNNRRLPLRLQDQSWFIDGYRSAIQLSGNQVADSVYHNFHPGMPDTSTVIPYNEIKVLGPAFHLAFFPEATLGIVPGLLKAGDSVSLSPVFFSAFLNRDTLVLPRVDGMDTSLLGNYHPFQDQLELRISVNGKLLFDWKPLNSFPREIYKASAVYKSTGGTGRAAMAMYADGFKICDTSLQLNDQLLIEIKENKKGWILDRFNITRVPGRPLLAAVFLPDKKTFLINPPGEEPLAPEKKILSLNAGNKLVDILFKEPPVVEYSNIEYIARMVSSNDSNWLTLSKGLSSLRLELLSGEDYELFLRYSLQRESVSHYILRVSPHWWETYWFKWLTGTCLVILVSWLSFRLYQDKKRYQLQKKEYEHKKAFLEMKAIRSQLNPHFVFNALSSIQGLMNNNQIDHANRYLSEFSSLMRNTLESADPIFNSLQKEIDLLNSYLKLEQLRFGFLYHISVAEDLDTRGLEIPSLFLQPAVENAVKHGVSGLQEKGTINVRFFRIDADLFAEIRDNGGGFHPPPAMGYGLKLTKERVDLLNQLFKGKEISQKIESSPEGTLVQFIFSGWL